MSASKITPNKRRKTDDLTKPQGGYQDLGHILCIANFDETISRAIINVIEKNPSAASVEYEDVCRGNISTYPLHIVIYRRASFDVVNTLYQAFPDAIKEKCHGATALHLACEKNAPLDVISLLVNEYPHALSQTDKMGGTPLHEACKANESLDVVSLLLKSYPEAAKMQNKYGGTPLHEACWAPASIEVISLLLENFPDAVKIEDDETLTPLHYTILFADHSSSSFMDVILLLLESYPAAAELKCRLGKTAFHHACEWHWPIEALSLLFEKYPAAILQKDLNGNTPLHLVCMDVDDFKVLCFLLEKYPSAIEKTNDEDQLPIDYVPGSETETCMVLNNVYGLVKHCVELPSVKRIIQQFVDIEWWGGVLLVFDLYPSIVKSSEDVHLSMIPSLLSAIGRRCKLLTLWKLISNRQDILKIS